MSTKNILMVVSSAAKLNKTHPTGVWLEEFAVPYKIFNDNNYKITTASPKGGSAPVDKASIQNFAQNPLLFALELLDKTEKLENINYKNYDAIVLPGGHGPVIDLYNNYALGKILKYFNENNLIIAAICHGPAGLISCCLDGGNPLVCNKRITSFTNEEEKLAKKDKLVPFSLEDKLKSLGCNFIKTPPGSKHVIVDENLITGQNYQSSELFAKTIVERL